MLQGYENVFTPYVSTAYNDLTVRTCIDTIARHAAKLKPTHVRKSVDKTDHLNSQLNYLLSSRPNPYMSTYDFIYKLITQLYTYNNALVYVQLDAAGSVVALWPLSYSSLRPLEYQDDLYIQFTFGNGKQVTVPYNKLIHLRRHFNGKDFFGDDSQSVLTDSLSLLQTLKQGLINLVKNSVKLSGFLKFSQNMSPEDLEKKVTAFANTFKNISSKTGGIAGVDNTCDFNQLTSEIKSADNDQINSVRQDVYRYFGLNDNIIKGDYNESQWQAFYESIIEPLAIQLGQEFSAKLFTPRELGFGNEILFVANALQYSNTANKVNMIKELMPLGILTINQALDILSLPPVEDGDKRLQTLNMVNTKLVDKYQTGSEPTDPEGGDKVDDQNEPQE